MSTRREFVQHTGLAVAAVAVSACSSSGPLGSGGCPSPAAPGDVRIPLLAVGASALIPNRGLCNQGVAVTRLSATAVVAVSLQCTHQGCTVQLPAAPGQNMQCPCHGSVFTTSGAVVNGPAVSPLQQYAARIDGTDAVVTFT